MNPLRRLCVLFPCFIVLLICISSATAQPTTEAAMQSVTESENAFAADLYANLATQPGNLFFSPYSIHTALAMAWDGAGGSTAQQMAATLHLNGEPGSADPAFAGLIDAINRGGQGREDQPFYTLTVANALWTQNGYPIHPDYAQRVRNAFAGEISDVDFAGQLEAARAKINTWVADRTAGKIKELLSPRSIDPATRYLLTNAIYFKSSWQSKFSKSATSDEPFHVTADQTATVPMMHQRTACGYFEDDDVQAISLPYIGSGLSMVLILPKQMDGIGKLKADKLNGYASQMQRAEVTIALPRFKLSATMQLSKALASLGMPDAFAPEKANFQGIATAENLFIGEVIHQATVDVDEDGTEASAATALTMVGAARARLEEKTFTADHPFVFLIRQQKLGNVLFMGRLNDPR